MGVAAHDPDLLVRLFATLLAVLPLIGVSAASAQPAGGGRSAYVAAQARTPDLSQVPQLIVRYTNDVRKAQGAEPTAANEPLSRAAGHFAEFMARTDQYGHGADGRTPSARAKEHGYNFCMIAENIAYQFHSAGFGTDELAQRFLQGWEKSPGHRKNMLDPDAMDTAVAVARSTRTGRYYAVQMFGRPRSATYSFQVANQSGSTGRYQFAGQEFELQPRSTRTHEHCRSAPLVMHGGTGVQGQNSIQPAHGDRFLLVRDRQALRLVRE